MYIPTLTVIYKISVDTVFTEINIVLYTAHGENLTHCKAVN